MIEQNIPRCALGLTTDILSAWRDGGFQGDEEQQIRQHTATCIACQRRLDGFAMVARALERQQELDPGDRIWRGVHARISSQRRAKFPLPRSLGWSWQSVASAASVILIVGLLAYVFNAARTQRSGPAPTSTATSAIMPTPLPTLTSSVITPGPRLSWQQAHLPSGIEVTMASLALGTLVVAPSNGDVAYLSMAPAEREGMAQETSAQIYITHDRGQTWGRGEDILVGAPPPSTSKGFTLWRHITVDATRPGVAVVETEWRLGGEAGDISKISTFVSFDYSTHWRKLAYPSPFIIGPRMASFGGAIFTSSDGGLWVSRDEMATWQALALPSGIVVSDFWLNPSTGALLVAANQQGSENSLLFSSTDSSARWTQLPAPSLSEIAWIVQPPQGTAPWRICGATTSSYNHPQPQENTLMCSSDGGQTWTKRPALNIAADSPKGFQTYAPATIFALTGDGAVLATILIYDRPAALYRLTTDGSSWQDIGPVPADPDNATYAPTSTGGALWMSGPDVYVASYPPE